jgi:hypothetical protein
VPLDRGTDYGFASSLHASLKVRLTQPLLTTRGGTTDGSRSSESLWELAADKLKPEDQQLIDFANPDKSAVLRDLLALTEQKKAFCIENRLSFTRKNGQVIVLRDLFDKITTWIEKFIEIGNIIVQYDTGHAALPWAGVRFILQVS